MRVRTTRGWAAGILAICVLAAGAALADAWAPTTSGSCQANDGQDWGFWGRLRYRSLTTSGATEQYDWDYGNGAELTLEQGTNYVDHEVRFRAAIVYDTSTLLWQSCPQAMMERRVLNGTSADVRSWTIPDDKDSWEGSLTLPVDYKVQSAKDDQLASIVARQVTLLHDQ